MKPPKTEFPAGDLRRLFLHWTAGDYVTVSPAYHFCIARGEGGLPSVVAAHDLRANMRDVRAEGDAPYAAHTAGRNSYAIGIAVCAMRDATPADFGQFPLRDDLLAAACALAARLCAFYRIPLDREHVATHAEAAVDDGYFGSGPQERWDIARLRAEPGPLRAAEAGLAGGRLRARIAGANLEGTPR